MSGIMNNIYNNVTFALHRQTEQLMRLQEQSTTGSRVNRPSDDPSTGYQVLTLESEKGSLENYIAALNDMSSTLETSSSVIQQITSIISQAQVDITQIASGIYNQEGRDRTAGAINDALEQLVQLANTKQNDQYLFGGSAAGSTPYVVERSNGEITSVSYQGSMESRSSTVAPGVSSNAYFVGQELFGSNQRGAPVFDGTTGVAPGSGTSSVTGDVWLTVTYDGSNYQLSIDDGATTVVVPAGGDTNLAVTDSRTGKVLYVDTAGITSAGVEHISVPGTFNAFDLLINLRDMLKNDRNLSEQQIQQIRNNSVSSLEEVQNHLVQKQVTVGSKIEFLANLKDGLEGVKANSEDQATRLQEADIAQIAIDLSRQEVLYQMSLSVAGKLMSLSLLDFIE